MTTAATSDGPLELRPIIDPALQAYAEQVATTPRRAELDELDVRTRAELGMGIMLSGTAVGRLLETLVAISGAQQVLEIGTFSGVSALHMAEALPGNGRIISCEVDPKRAAFARAAFVDSPHAERIELREGPALHTLATLPGPFDLVFIDADKISYRAYVEAALQKLARPRGLIVLDNTLYEGEVIKKRRSQNAEALDLLNRWLAQHPDLIAVQLTVRDGLTLVRRRIQNELA
jgi:caffeoyl-CoA O-methyltransferase